MNSKSWEFWRDPASALAADSICLCLHWHRRKNQAQQSRSGRLQAACFPDQLGVWESSVFPEHRANLGPLAPCFLTSADCHCLSNWQVSKSLLGQAGLVAVRWVWAVGHGRGIPAGGWRGLAASSLPWEACSADLGRDHQRGANSGSWDCCLRTESGRRLDSVRG